MRTHAKPAADLARGLARDVVTGLATALALGGMLAACDPPNPDTFRRDGGAAPDPTGVMEGTVLYVGPRPDCVRGGEDGRGDPQSVIGAVVLTLFEYDNPPPPAGSASSAISLLTVPGETMFSLSDCMPLEPTAADLRPIMRSAAFIWPELALGRDPCTENAEGNLVCPPQDYQVRGFYDRDGDFNPFFGVRNLPTAGDVGGGAFELTAVSPPIPLRIRFGHITEQNDGQVVEGVAVTLGAVVNTERPIFEIEDQSRAMDSSALLPLGSDPVARENALRALTDMHVTAIVGGTSDRATLDAPWLAAMGAAGIDPTHYVASGPFYGFHIGAVDANNDRMGDLHPILGSAMISWYTPMIITRRAKNPIETRLGLPDVSIIGTIRPTFVAGLETDFVTPRTMMAFEVVMPPVAVMFTNPELPAICRAPIIPPGNYRQSYEARWADCQDLPTGNYDVNVLNGLAGGTNRTGVESCMLPCVADCIAEMGMEMQAACEASCMPNCEFVAARATSNGFVVDGGSYSSQAWSLPNDLGCPDVLYRPTAVNQLDPRGSDGSLPGPCDDAGAPPEGSVLLPSQSRQSTWAIVDTGAPFTPGDPGAIATAEGHGIAACLRAVPQAGGEPEDVTYMQPPTPACCPARLDQFCGLPLCPLRDAGTVVPADPAIGLGEAQVGADGYPYPQAVRPVVGGTSRLTREIRVPGEDYTVNADGTITPLCTPFLMPVACCQMAETCATNPDACPR